MRQGDVGEFHYCEHSVLNIILNAAPLLLDKTNTVTTCHIEEHKKNKLVGLSYSAFSGCQDLSCLVPSHRKMQCFKSLLSSLILNMSQTEDENKNYTSAAALFILTMSAKPI